MLIERIVSGDSAWRFEPLPLGLKKEIPQDKHEAKHFDGFVSMSGYKFDAEVGLINLIADDPKFKLLPNKNVIGFLHNERSPEKITGVKCVDGSSFSGKVVVLAAGAMTSPRLLQDYLEQTGLEKKLPSSPVVGAKFKFHINSALLAFSPFTHHDILRKTAIFFNDKFPHTTVQCLGWVDGEIMASQLPAAVPKFVANAMGRRAYGFFVTTEDGSSPHICFCTPGKALDRTLGIFHGSGGRYVAGICSISICWGKTKSKMCQAQSSYPPAVYISLRVPKSKGLNNENN
jgi:choline dehydrogenase-like flavoprotein